EPTADLDPGTAHEVLVVLLDLHRRHRTTLVLVTHDEATARLADRVVRIDGGRVVADTTPVERPPAPATVLTAPVPATARLGSGFGAAAARSAAALLVGAGVVAALDHAAATAFHRRHDREQSARRDLEAVALRQLWAEVERIEPAPDGSYSVT